LQQQISLKLIRLDCLLAQERNLIADLSNFVLQLLRSFAAAVFPADFFAQALAIRIQLLQRRFGFAPLGIDAKYFIDLRRVVAAASREASFHEIWLFANQSNVEHGRRV
jgi:hypothetical protein